MGNNLQNKGWTFWMDGYSPITFTRMMNDMFKSFIVRFIIVYFDDILTYNKDKEEHLSHLQVVFQTLRS
jgi:hypothetical protein